MKCYGLFLLFVASHLLAFDGKESLDFPDFNRENFLDISAYQYSKQQDDKWFNSDNGFRLAGGSLGQDFLYSHLHFKYRTQLNAHTEFRLSSKQEAFYATKPVRQQVELGGRVNSSWYFSLLGSPSYEKRNSDLGVAMELGNRPLNYLRLAYIRHDIFFNEKNPQDDAGYERIPIERQLEWVRDFSHKFYLRLYLYQDKPSVKTLATDLLGNQGYFSYEGDSGDLMLDYHFKHEKILGMRVQGFNFNKQLQNGVVNARQKFHYFSVQNYLMFPAFKELDMTLGWRHDQLNYNTWYPDNTADDVERYFDTSQLFGILKQSLNNRVNFEYALHLGEAQLQKNHFNRKQGKENDSAIESKFRFSIELLSLDGKNQLMFGSNWNLDDIQGQVWDGGQLSFQGVF